MKLPTEQEVKQHVIDMTKSKMLKGFYASIVQKQLKANPEMVQNVLIDMVKEGILLKEYELICSNDHCLRVIDQKEEFNQFHSEYDCEFCGEEMEEIEPSQIQIRFLVHRQSS